MQAVSCLWVSRQFKKHGLCENGGWRWRVDLSGSHFIAIHYHCDFFFSLRTTVTRSLNLRFSRHQVFGRHKVRYVIQVVPSARGLGWIDFDLRVQPCCPAAQPLLPNYHQPRQNWAESGILKIQVNLTQSTSR